ncbi:MAG TPA: hypothetical protein VGU68_01925, partial [Ktedonobacteraceae bacterium]|nr:hypothetical protein [Ktedonobacteraceae bacterium]
MYYWTSDEEAGARSALSASDTEHSPLTFAYTQGDRAGRPETAAQDARSRLQERALAPIGVFDSGAGGLTILSALRQEMPQEHYIYFGDTAYCPYGVRSEAEITELTIRACRFLIEQGVKLIVIACNTASQAALNSLRATFSLPFVGV